MARVGRPGAVLRLDRRRAPQPRRRELHDPLHAAQAAQQLERGQRQTRGRADRAEGLMRPAGVAAFERRSDDRTAIYAYEQRKTAKLDAEQERRFAPTPARGSGSRPSPPATGGPPPLGHQRQAPADARAAPRAAHRGLRERADDPLAHAAVEERSVRRRAGVSAAAPPPQAGAAATAAQTRPTRGSRRRAGGRRKLRWFSAALTATSAASAASDAAPSALRRRLTRRASSPAPAAT